LLKRIIGIGLAAVMLAAVAAPCARAQAQDVPADHWAYDAIQMLARKGIVLGYPDGNFLGQRSLTRYEMAAIVQRVLRYLEAEKAGQTKPVTPSPTTPAQPSVSASDLETVRKLVDEFKVELTVMGTDLKQVQEEVATLRQQMDTVLEDMEPIKAQVLDPEGTLNAVANDVSKMKKLSISGYVQARYEDSAEANKYSQFYVRRARLKAKGSFGEKTKVIFQIDAGGGDKNTSLTLKDAYLEYGWLGVHEFAPKITFGQFKWPFGYEVVESSSVREAPERSDVLRALFPGERDRGVMLSGPPAAKVMWNIGLFSGVGIDQKGAPWWSANFSDNNQHKDVVGNIRVRLTDNFFIGGSGYWGKAGPQGQLQDRTRWGADLQWYGVAIPLSIKAEYVSAKEPSGPANAPVNRKPSGYYAQAAWSFNPFLTLVYKYDLYDDDGLGTRGEHKNHQLGLIRWLDDKSRLKLFYQWRREERNSIDNDVATVEWITTF